MFVDEPSDGPISCQFEADRGILLTGVLVLIVFGNMIALGLYVHYFRTGVAPFTSLSAADLVILAAVPTLNIAAGLGIWYFRKWGVYLWIVVSLVAPAVNSFLGAVPLESLPLVYVGSAVGAGVVVLLVRRLWRTML